MSQSDSFIEEVTEEVRRDRLFAVMRRYGWIAVLAIVLIVGGASWREYSQAQDRARAEALGDAIFAALEEDDSTLRAEALSAIDAETGGAAALRDMLRAADLGRARDDDAAVALLEQVASNGDVPEFYREIASFKAVSRPGDVLSASDRRIRLEALAVPGKPLRLLAEEQLAMLDIDDDNRDAALERLRRISTDAEATPGLRQRAVRLIVALGGTPEAG